MRPDQHSAGVHSVADSVLETIGSCLRQGCVICIEHTPVMGARFTPWRKWGQECCYSGDDHKLVTELDRCLAAHPDHHIRLNIEDFSFHSRFSLVVHSPLAAAA